MTLYKHVVTVVVITPECSPDRIIDWLEHAPISVGDHATRLSAAVTAADRAATPYQRVPDPPACSAPASDRSSWAAYHEALDRWVDGLPTVETFAPDGRA